MTLLTSENGVYLVAKMNTADCTLSVTHIGFDRLTIFYHSFLFIFSIHKYIKIYTQDLSIAPRRVTKTDYKELQDRGNAVLMKDYKVINTSIAYIIFFIVSGWTL